MAKILVIEHEAILREETAAWLTLEGFTVLSAKDGLTGVDSAFRHEPDLILCDLTLPGMDGYAVLAEIRAHPATAYTPFLFLTGVATQIEIRQGLGVDADDYMIKPLHCPELLAAIHARVAGKPRQEEQRLCEVELLQEALVQEQVQQQIKANLLGMLADDGHNPLTDILLAHNLFCGQAAEWDEQANLTHCNHVEASVRQLIYMLDDVLLVAQLDIGLLDVKPEPVHIGQFLQQIVEDFQTIQGEKYQICLATHTRTPVLIDKRLLRQVAINLIANALQRSAIGGSVYILVESHKAGCRLVVQDHGLGLHDQTHSHLCDPFANGANRAAADAGLGLAQIKQAVELQGGSFNLESRVDGGSTITVTIPTHSRAVKTPAVEHSHRQATASWRKMAA